MYHRFRETLGKASLKTVIIVSFLLAVTSVSVVSFVQSYFFTVSIKAKFAAEMEQRIRKNVFDNIDSYLQVPENLNFLNATIAKTGQMDLQNQEKLKTLLLKEVTDNNLIDYVYYANEQGGMVTIGRFQGEYTQVYTPQMAAGTLTFDRIDSSGKKLRFVKENPNFDPRTRPWYSAAKESKSAHWSNVYMGISVPTLVVTHSVPLLDEAGRVTGVFGTSILLDRFSEYMKTLRISENGAVYLVDSSGILIATSAMDHPFVQQNGQILPIQAADSDDPVLSASWDIVGGMVREDGSFSGDTGLYHLAGNDYYLDISRYSYQNHLNWYLMISIPKQDYNQGNRELYNRILFTMLVLLLLSVLLGMAIARKILRPIRALNQKVLQIRAGEWGEQIDSVRSDELGELTHSFNEMSSTIQQSYASLLEQKTQLEYLNTNLEEIVRKRTEELHTLSITDELTGLYNHRYIVETLHKRLLEAKESRVPLSVCMLDIDFFKKVNDTYGHLEGNRVLVAIASYFKENIRPDDILGRYGGEEFLLILPNTTVQQAYELTDRLREEITRLRIGENSIQVRISGGVAECTSESVDEIIRMADQRLYRAKSEGRNRIMQ